ncbi:hypothetical protein RISK_000953 [Rhodopirellula islandica]|uniref:Uncharacterized protein n=1 Tax=Rhodopirellula islandica TaxID=595434 RepID=A0A0J1BKW9_RHOIS|nr:hypothetical protein RISK_000953 [Rhodopirellula islandica]
MPTSVFADRLKPIIRHRVHSGPVAKLVSTRAQLAEKSLRTKTRNYAS